MSVTIFDRARHVPMPPDPWDPEVAKAAINEIVDDAIKNFDAARFWPVHPQDDEAPDGSSSIYIGAAGVMWALDHLKRTGAVDKALDYSAVLPALAAASRAE